jgi:hypothetical protein
MDGAADVFAGAGLLDEVVVLGSQEAEGVRSVAAQLVADDDSSS